MDPEQSKRPALRGQAAAWLLRLEEAPDDQALRAEYEAWLAQSERHRKAHDTIASLWRSAEELGSVEPALQSAKVAMLTPRRPRVRRLAWAGAALAACLALLAFPAVQLRLAADYMTGVAEVREVVLEDGSRASLDAGSAIAVDYTAKQRTVTLLAGQAFFEVVASAERPFVVAASDVRVTVTGTSFSVGTFSTGVSVDVETGTVNVSRDDGQLLADLAVGQHVRIASGGVTRRASINPDEVAPWRDHRLVVYQATIRDVVEQIGRYMPGAIVFRDREIADRLVTGIINLNRPDEALQAVVEMQNGKVANISPYLVVISSR